MDIINQAMLYLLNQLHSLVGSYGWAIILLTVLLRVLVWPLNTKQQQSMKKMQELQPKLKALQEKFKDNPAKMQEAMMKFYAEHSFNPLAGCFPMLIQLPILIALYGTLSSPQFLVETVNEPFYFVHSLSHTMRTHAGPLLDGTFSVKKDDRFSIDRHVTLTMANGATQAQAAKDPGNAVTVSQTIQGVSGPETVRKLVAPGSPLNMTLELHALGLSDDERNLIASADVLVKNNNSNELEKVHFTNQNGVLQATLPTLEGKDQFNVDVLILVLLYAVLTLGYQKVMTANQPKPDPNASKDDPAAAAMNNPVMKLMPLLFPVLMFIFPIPAGVMLYLVVTIGLMMFQTLWVNISEDRKKAAHAAAKKPSDQVVEVKADRV